MSAARIIAIGWLIALGILIPWGVPHAQFQSTGAPYVPTLPAVIDAMFDMARVSTNDYVIDLGSGDGRIVIEAASKHGASGMGVELDANLVRTATEEAKRRGVGDKISFVRQDLFNTDLSRASVLTLYLSRTMNVKLRPRILSELRPGTRVLAHDFDMGNWKPDQHREVAAPGKSYGPPVSQIYLWYVPADIAGKWRWQLTIGGTPHRYEATMRQSFQEIDGEVLVDGGSATTKNIKLRGDALNFTVAREMFGRIITHEFSGRVEGSKATGRVKVSGGGEDATADWVATRVERGIMRME
jgi:hypothetical protein